MIISTTPTLQTSEIIEYQGFISAEVISGVNVVKDLFAAFTDFFGGRSSKYESALIKAKNDAMDELVAKAKKM